MCIFHLNSIPKFHYPNLSLYFFIISNYYIINKMQSFISSLFIYEHKPQQLDRYLLEGQTYLVQKYQSQQNYLLISKLMLKASIHYDNSIKKNQLDDINHKKEYMQKNFEHQESKCLMKQICKSQVVNFRYIPAYDYRSKSIFIIMKTRYQKIVQIKQDRKLRNQFKKFDPFNQFIIKRQKTFEPILIGLNDQQEMCQSNNQSIYLSKKLKTSLNENNIKGFDDDDDFNMKQFNKNNHNLKQKRNLQIQITEITQPAKPMFTIRMDRNNIKRLNLQAITPFAGQTKTNCLVKTPISTKIGVSSKENKYFKRL
ncbi:hypothetical protein pb186bvf_008979 [Paramecium bursaria]